MPIIEFQVKASTFLTMQRNALRNLAICPPTLPVIAGVQIVIDRIDFGNSVLRHHKPGNFVTFYDEDGELLPTPYQPDGFITQLAQDITLHLTTQADILAHPNADPTLVPITATLVFDLDFYPVDHDCYISGGISAIEWGPLPLLPLPFNPLSVLPAETQGTIKAFALQQLRLFTSTGAVPVGLSALPAEMRFINAGVGVDNQMQFIALRVQVGGGSNMNADVPWQQFFKGNISDRLQGNDFAFFVESTLLSEAIKYKVYENLPKNDNLETFPDCIFSRAQGKAIFTIDVLIIYHIYRNHYLDLDITVDAEPKVDIAFSVAHPNEITIDFDFSHLLDGDDPLVNFVFDLANLLGFPVQEILLTLAGNYILPGLQKEVSANATKLSNTHIQCTKDVHLPLLPGSLQTTLTKLVAFDNGFALAGSINARDLSAAVITTSINEFKITVPSISCGSASLALVAAFQNDPTGFGVLKAKGFIQNMGNAAMRLCNQPTVQKGAAGPFLQKNISVDGNLAPIDILINIAAPPIDYYKAPYPLDLLVKTSGGTRLLRFAPPPEITQEDYQRLAAGLLVKIGNCQQLVDGWSRLHSGYNPRWSPRPPEGSIVEHQWETVINGLKEGEKVALIDAENREIATAESTNAPLRLMAVLSPGGERELSVKYMPKQNATTILRSILGEHDETENEVTIEGIEVRQTLLTHKGSLPLRGKCKKLLPLNLANRQCVAAVLEDSITLYDFSNGHKPVVFITFGVEGARGIVSWQNRLLTYGDEGAMQWEMGSKKTKVQNMFVCVPVKDLAINRKNLYALTQEGINVYSSRLCKMASYRLEGAESIMCLGDKLVVAGKEGLFVMNPDDMSRLHKCKSNDDFKMLRPAFANEPGLFVAQLQDGTAKAYCYTNGNLEVVTEYAKTPWHTNAVKLGRLILKIAPNNTIVNLYMQGTAELM